jgi:hypothetical protein
MPLWYCTTATTKTTSEPWVVLGFTRARVHVAATFPRRIRRRETGKERRTRRGFEKSTICRARSIVNYSSGQKKKKKYIYIYINIMFSRSCVLRALRVAATRRVAVRTSERNKKESNEEMRAGFRKWYTLVYLWSL